jgi:Zn-dependent protease with chaperone function
MNKKSDISRLHSLLEDLKTKQLIDQERKLVSDRFVSQFQGIFGKIRYNEQFCNRYLEDLDDNVLRFILLHEEGHLKSGTKLPSPVFAIIVILFIVCIYIYQISLLISIFYLLFLLALAYRVLFITLYKEEFKVDLFAAELMKNKFDIKQPSQLLSRFLRSVEEKGYSKKPNRVSQLVLLIFMILTGIFPDYHPANCSRILNIERNIDERVDPK